MNQFLCQRWLCMTIGLFLLGGWGTTGLSQGISTSGITGTVTIVGGAPAAGAEVMVIHSGTGGTIRVMTGDDGRYFIGNLRPGGPYLITVARIGLVPGTRGDINLTTSEILRIDFELTTEALRLEGIEVSATSDPIFSSARTGAASILRAETLTRLPTISRNIVDFTNLSPLVRVTDGAISVAGQNHRYNAIVVDGALSQDLFGISRSGIGGGQTNAKLIPLDAVEQYQIQVAPYDVRMSGFTGGLLNFVTRSGTNEWQATAFGIARDQRLLGDIVVDGISAGPGDLSRQIGGFTVGGPLRHDRLHLFVAGETERVRQSTSGYSHGIVAPIRTSLAADSAQRFRDIMQQRYNVDPGTASQYSLESPIDNLFIRLDFLARPDQRIILRHNLVHAESDIAANREPVAEYGFSSNGYRHRNRTNTTTLHWYADIGGSFSNELLLNHHRIRDRAELASDFPLVDVGIRSNFDGVVVFRQTRAGANLFAQAGDLDQDVFQLTNNLTGRFGGHILTAGLSAEQIRIRHEAMVGGLGRYRFGSLAALEANQPESYQRQIFLPGSGEERDTAFRLHRLGIYIQDDWSPRENLTFRAGLRADLPAFRDTPGRNPAFKEEFGRSTASLPSGNLQFSPRFGFNWRLDGETPTQFRGGAGLFVGTLPLTWVADAFLNNGMRSAFLTCEGANAPGFAAAAPAACLDGTGPGANLPATVTVFDPKFRYPRDFRSSLALDRALPFGFVGTVEWVYTKALDQVALRDINLEAPVEDPQHADGYSDVLGRRSHFGTPTVTGFTPNRRSNNFTQVIEISNGAVNYSYALGFELQRNIADHLQLRSGYAYSRSGDTQSLVSSNTIENLALNANVELPGNLPITPSHYDRPHKVTASATAQLPDRWGAGEITLHYMGQSGQPYTYVYLDDVNGDGYPGHGATLDGTNDPVYLPLLSDQGHAGISSALYIAQLAELDPCVKKFQGTILPRNHCRAPWSDRLDLRIMQPVHLLGVRAEIAGDLVNVMNLLNRDWGQVHEVRSTVPLLMLAGRKASGLLGATPTDPMMVSYAGPIRTDPNTGRAGPVVPFTAVFPASQWQAQLGFYLRF